MKKMLLLMNPVSGKLALADALMEVVCIFGEAGYDVTIHMPGEDGDMFAYAKENGSAYDLVVCCGGDGTLNIVATAIYEAGANTRIGYIPGGTTNDFANTHRIDSIVTGAARQITGGVERAVDLGMLCGKPFIYVAAFGLFSDVSYETPREQKKNFGHAAYVISGIKSLAKAKPVSLQVEHVGEVLEGEFIFGMVSNSKRIGGFELPIIENVLYDDGEMEVTLVESPKNPSEMSALISSLLTQSADNENIHMFKTASLSFESESEIPWSLDGEYGGSYQRGTIEVKCGAICMIF